MENSDGANPLASSTTREPAALSESQARVHQSLTQLLARAGLEYRGGFVEVAGMRIHYLDYGAGPPVVLVHGGGAGAGIWYRQIAALSTSFRVIAPDLPVFGLSAQSATPSPLRRFAPRFLGEFMDQMAIGEASIAGLSLGAILVLGFALEQPKRVKKLALIDAAGLGRALPWGFRLATVPVVGRLLTRASRRVQRKLFTSTEVIHADRPDTDVFLQYAYDVSTVRGHALALRRQLPTFATLRGQRVIFSDEELAAIEAETLVVWGESDAFFPVAHAERAARLIPNVRLEVLSDAGHVSIWDQPERVNDLLAEFLR